MSPQKVYEYLRDEFKEYISQKRVYAFKQEVFPEVKTVAGLNIIIPCDDEDAGEVTTNEIKQLGLRIIKRDFIDCLNGRKQIATASIGQIVGMLNNMDEEFTRDIPIEEIVDNNKALSIVTKGSKYE